MNLRPRSRPAPYGSPRWVDRRALFSPPLIEPEPWNFVPPTRTSETPPTIVYDGPVPDLANPRAASPSRGLAQRIEVVPRRQFALGVKASVPLTEIIVAPLIPTAAWSRGLLVVRLHQVVSFAGGTTRVLVIVQAVSRSADDPAVAFVDATTLAGVSFSAGSSAPTQRTDAFTPSGYVRVVLQTDCNASTTTATLDFTLSIALVGRSGA